MDLEKLDEISASPTKKGFAKKRVEAEAMSDIDNFVIDITKDYTFELCQKHIAVNTYRPPYPRTYQIAGVITIWDSVAKRAREIRNIETSTTIFMDEQIEEGYGRELNTTPIVFIDGKLTVRGLELNKMRFILASDQCKKDTRRLSTRDPIYYLLDFDAVKRKTFSTLKLARDAQDHAWNCTEEEMMPTAYALGINVTQATDYIRAEFVQKATDSPELFNKISESPKNKISYLIRTALDKDLISLTKNEGTLVWSDSGTAIVGLPVDKDEISFITDFSIKEKAGQEFIKKLRSIEG